MEVIKDIMIMLSDCDKCIHEHEELLDGWNMACDAFPDGIPYELVFGDAEIRSECNNGIRFEKKE